MYPQEIDKFSIKLNKKQSGVYTVEEKIYLTDGSFDGFLAHDNINKNTILIYTESKCTGDKIQNFILSVPSETPWKFKIKIYSNTEFVYVTYETPGDVVEADDINILQEAIIALEIELERHKEDSTTHFYDSKIDGGSFL